MTQEPRTVHSLLLLESWEQVLLGHKPLLAVQALFSRLYLHVVLSLYIATFLRSAQAKTVPRSWLDSNCDPTAAGELIFDRLSGNCTPFRTAATGSLSLRPVSILQSKLQPVIWS